MDNVSGIEAGLSSDDDMFADIDTDAFIVWFQNQSKE